MDELKAKKWVHILHFFRGETAHGKECGYEVGHWVSYTICHANHSNINKMEVMESLTLKAQKATDYRVSHVQSNVAYRRECGL